MTIIQALILGLVQGATEFLPVSSSAHLVLVPWLLNWNAPGLVFDTVVHLGTLLAVVIYFWKDILQIVVGVLNTLKARNLNDPHGKLGWIVVVGTIPAALIGYLLESTFEKLFGAPAIVLGFLFITGLVLFITERISAKIRPIESLTWKDALLIGLAQAAAIAPGISRSGSTIAAGLALGIKREAATRFSFLLVIPIILGAGIFKLKDAFDVGFSGSETTTLIIGFAAAAISGYAAISYLLAFVRKHSLYVFAGYCWAVVVILGIVMMLR